MGGVNNQVGIRERRAIGSVHAMGGVKLKKVTLRPGDIALGWLFCKSFWRTITLKSLVESGRQFNQRNRGACVSKLSADSRGEGIVARRIKRPYIGETQARQIRLENRLEDLAAERSNDSLERWRAEGKEVEYGLDRHVIVEKANAGCLLNLAADSHFSNSRGTEDEKKMHGDL